MRVDGKQILLGIYSLAALHGLYALSVALYCLVLAIQGLGHYPTYDAVHDPCSLNMMGLADWVVSVAGYHFMTVIVLLILYLAIRISKFPRSPCLQMAIRAYGYITLALAVLLFCPPGYIGWLLD